MTHEITLKLSLSSELLSDILDISAGGIGYWAEVPMRDHPIWETARKDHGEQETENENPARAEYSKTNWIIVRPSDDEGLAFQKADPRNEYQIITHAKLVQAIQKIVDPVPEGGKALCGPQYIEWLRTAAFEDDASHIDAEVADIVVQVAAFGEVVFG